MSKKIQQIKITEENYEDYAKLYNEKKVIYERKLENVMRISLGGAMLCSGALAVNLFIRSKPLLEIAYAGLGVLALNIPFWSKELNWLSKNQKLQLKRAYPNINVNISYDKLGNILEEYMIVDGYAKAEKIKKELYQTSIDHIKNTHFSSRDYKKDCKPLDFPKYLIKK